jgi:ketosteroid isomerase-like protein
MTIEQLARDFTAAVRADDAKTYQAMWADDIVSIEPGDGDDARTEGREALLAKHAWWEANAEMHGFTAEGPYIHGDQFTLRFAMDVTMQGDRVQATEIALYTVEDGKIAEERFFRDAGA